MRKYFLVPITLTFFQISYAQSNFQVQNLAAFCKVWGFLKYYHPATSERGIDWDTVLTNNYLKVKNAQNKEEFNRIIYSITQKLGELKPVTKSFNPSDSEAVNADFKWMDDTTLLSSRICDYLRRVKINHSPFKNKYIGTNSDDDTKVKDKPYPEMVYPDEAYRFLALARYWNIINYYFPDKYLMDTDWNTSLEKTIPIFMNAPNQDEYYRAIEWITAKTNDGHANMVKNPYISYSDYKYPPFAAYYSHDTLIVVNIASDSIAAIFNIHKGDAIIAINGKPVKDLWQDILDHHSASNEGYMEYFMGSVLI